jgi:hypothetical protein
LSPNEHVLPKVGDDGLLMVGAALPAFVESVGLNGLHDPNEQLPPGHCESNAQLDWVELAVSFELGGNGEHVPATQLPPAEHCESNAQLSSEAATAPPEFSKVALECGSCAFKSRMPFPHPATASVAKPAKNKAQTRRRRASMRELIATGLPRMRRAQ